MASKARRMAGTQSFTVVTSTGGSKTATFTNSFPAGIYTIESLTGDADLEIYLGAEDGTNVGYVTGGSKAITASAPFKYVTTANANSSDAIIFSLYPALTNATTLATKTDAYWAPPTITDITPSGLPNVNDTTTITGTNFASNVDVKFRKSDDATLVNAKTIVRGSATSIIAGRPDSFAVGDAPYDVVVTNPSTTLSAISLNAITSGAVPVWVTSSTLNAATIDSAFSQTIQATDADGGSSITYAIVSGSFQTGLSLNTSTGAITGTPTGSAGSTTIVISATDSGGNAVNRTFTQVIDPAGLVVEYLAVGGGGGGGSYGGGGGAGGVITGTTPLDINTSYAIVIGSGGTKGIRGNNTAQTSGASSTFNSLSAGGGGYGGSGESGLKTTGANGSATNGSAGGGGYFAGGGTGSGTGGSGGAGVNSTGYPSGGGGGAGGNGASASGKNGGNGGAGITSSISGSSVTYAGGGGGGAGNDVGTGVGTSGTGGSSVGGNGGRFGISHGSDGALNTGSGGGGAGGDALNFGNGGNGSSGVVTIRYQSAVQRASGGNTVTNSGGYWIHTFTSSGTLNTTPSYVAKAVGGTITTSGGYWIHTFTGSGTFTPNQTLSVDYLVVAGGGAGGGDFGGGGGAGALRTSTSFSVSATNYSIAVGSGGAGAARAGVYPTAGGNSTFSSITSTGGGQGGTDYGVAAGNGGSGGGAATSSAGTGTTGGNNGGTGYASGDMYYGGGGGGAGAAGSAGTVSGNDSTGGAGGAGLASSISGSSVTYAGGGGGFAGSERGGVATPGAGGTGGGGTGGANNLNGSPALAPTSGMANRGGGGGGASNRSVSYPGGNGGSGIVIIRYPV